MSWVLRLRAQGLGDVENCLFFSLIFRENVLVNFLGEFDPRCHGLVAVERAGDAVAA